MQDDMKHWPFKVAGDKEGKPMIEVAYEGKQKKFHPEEISAMVVRSWPPPAGGVGFGFCMGRESGGVVPELATECGMGAAA